MEFEGLTDKQAEAILTLVEISGIDIAKARQLLERTDYNVQHAAQLYFNPQPQPVYYEQMQPVPQAHREYGNPADYYQDSFDENQDPVYTRYRNYRYSGTNFQSKYPLEGRTSLKGMLNWVVSKFKGEVGPGSIFLQRLQTLFPETNRVKFLKGTFLEAMYTARKQKFPLIVLLHDFSQRNNLLLRTLISNTNAADFFNVTFRIIGFDTTAYELEPVLKKLIDSKNIPCMAIFKVDECEEIAIMDIIEIGPDTDLIELKKRVNVSKSKYIKDEIRESEYAKRFNNELNGIYDNNPMTFERKLQLAEERRIKEIQQKELKESNKQLQIKRKEQQLEKEKQKERERQGQRIIQQRKINRENLKTYKEGIRFRLRFPNGNQVQLIVPSDEKVQYLFDYVDSLEEVGFEENVWRKFDIIRPYDKLTLSEVKKQTLGEVFGQTDSQSLVVNEL